jgi:hypothetical protein
MSGKEPFNTVKTGVKHRLLPAFYYHSFISPISLLYHSTGIPISKRYRNAERMPKEWAFHDEGI